MRRKNTEWAFERLIWVCLVLLLPSSALAQSPPVDECLAYGYTTSENHHFLIRNNSSAFGETIQIIHNCDELSLYINGKFAASSSSNFSYNVEPGMYNLTFSSSNNSQTYNDVHFYPDRLNWEYQYQQIEDNKNAYILISESDFKINWAVAFSIVIVWVLSVFVYWSLINAYVERTFIEEVQQ